MRATSWCRQPEAKRRHPNSTAAAVVAAPRSVAHFLFGSISSIIVVISRLLVAPSSKKIAAIIGPRQGSYIAASLPSCPTCPPSQTPATKRHYKKRNNWCQYETYRSYYLLRFLKDVRWKNVILVVNFYGVFLLLSDSCSCSVIMVDTYLLRLPVVYNCANSIPVTRIFHRWPMGFFTLII